MADSNPGQADQGVSVVICCYNSAARLPQTLQHLAAQQVPAGFEWEVLLVNNASTDNTVACAREIWNSLDPGQVAFRVIEEPRPGQMYARKTGAREAIYDCLVFCDDDNWLAPPYIYLAWQTMQQDRAIGAAGGQNTAVTDAEAYPDWFEDYKDKYAIGIPAAASGDVSHKGFVLGAGLITRKSVFLAVFDERYPSILNGRNGEQLSTGDDFEFCKRLLLWDYKLYYNEGLHLKHFIPLQRLTLAYREKLMQGIADAGKVLTEYDLALTVWRKNRRKNRWRLLLLTPLRIKLAQWGLSGRRLIEEQGTLYYMAPFPFGNTQARIIIRNFINRK